MQPSKVFIALKVSLTCFTNHFPGAIACKFRNTGQTCICANRIFVQSTVYDEFASKLSARVEGFVVGDGLHEDTSVEVYCRARFQLTMWTLF